MELEQMSRFRRNSHQASVRPDITEEPPALEEPNPQRNPEFSLPPTDEGKDAYMFLATCFITEAFVWGFPYSYGFFQDYYSTHEPFSSSPAGIAAIGTTALGIMYLDAIVIFMFLQRFPNWRRPFCFIGVALIVVSLSASSWATSVWQLIVTQGALYAIGGSMLYYPLLLFLDEWFVRRKGIAFGIMWAGTGASGVAVPFICSWGLTHFPLPTILRIWGALMAVFLAPLLFFIKPRLPVTMSSTESSRRKFDFKFLWSPAFVALQTGNILQGMGYFIPGIYLPSYAQHVLGLDQGLTTVSISLLNVMGVFGCILVGVLVDRMHVTTVLSLIAVGSLLSVLIGWGFSSNAVALLLFSAFYGFFAGPFTTTYTGVVREVKKQFPEVETGLVIGMLSTGRGIGAVAAGPISERILAGVDVLGAPGYSGVYEPLIVFTGICMALGGLGFVAKLVGWM